MIFSKNEHEVKTYTYATAGKVKSNLTVTTKRVILSKKGKLGGSKIATSDEINLNSIEKISTSMVIKPRPIFLVFSIIFAVATALVYLFLYKQTLALIAGGALAILSLITYFISKKKSFYLILDTGVYEGVNLTANIGGIRTIKRKKTTLTVTRDIKVRLSPSVAKTIVEEIGSVILEAKEYGETTSKTETKEVE